MSQKFNFAPLENSGVLLTKWQKHQALKELPSPLYWIKPARKTLWNIELIRDLYLKHGGDRTAAGHQRLIEKYLNSLPDSA